MAKEKRMEREGPTYPDDTQTSTESTKGPAV